jgi:hypothetical protein
MAGVSVRGFVCLGGWGHAGDDNTGASRLPQLPPVLQVGADKENASNALAKGDAAPVDAGAPPLTASMNPEESRARAERAAMRASGERVPPASLPLRAPLLLPPSPPAYARTDVQALETASAVPAAQGPAAASTACGSTRKVARTRPCCPFGSRSVSSCAVPSSSP